MTQFFCISFNIMKYYDGGFMKQIVIEGNHTLSGTIEIGGAKNSAVALIPAAILSDDYVFDY